jgi:hypothetical protein
MIALCDTYNINFNPYYFTISSESPLVLKSFQSYFQNMLDKADMSNEYLHSHSTNVIGNVIDIMSHDIEYLLAGIACIQYFFL